MGSSATAKGNKPVVYVDANPMYDRHLTGIGRYTARVAMALAGCGADVRFFSLEREVHAPDGTGLVAGPGFEGMGTSDLERQD